LEEDHMEGKLGFPKPFDDVAGRSVGRRFL